MFTKDRSSVSKQGRGTLQRAMLYDLWRRQEILANEIRHLKSAINYRLPLTGGTDGQTTTPDSNVSGTNGHGSALALLQRIEKAADELLAQVDADQTELVSFHSWWSIPEKHKTPRHEVEEYQCFHQVWHAKMMVKASVVAERLGELHDRLGQQLERTNPDHPNPVLRRRAEQGQIDKFLCEHVKWVHRDLALFAKLLEANYPYTEVPATFYSWQYDASSSQHSFTSHKNFKTWKEWASSGSREPIHGEPEDGPPKFSSLGLSYWMPERLVSHPIIGHELAHQVLQDLYGRDSPYVRLEHQKDQLSRTLRRLTRCVEGWLIRRPGSRLTGAQTWALVREIMCDLLAAERYGCAFLYAWLLEMSEVEAFADFMHDSFGMLAPTEFAEVSPAYLQREIFAPSRALASTLRPDIYYRGKVLIAFLRAHKRETDELAFELLDEVENWLERFLDMATGVRADVSETTELEYGRNFEQQFARDLSLMVIEEYSRASSMDLAALPKWESKFVKLAAKHWDCKENSPTDFSLARQAMSNPLRTKYVETIRYFRPDVLTDDRAATRLRTFQDAVWRVEWAIESNDTKTFPRQFAPDFKLNALRALNFLATDDYLCRTGNPHRLLQAIALRRPEKERTAADETALQLINKRTRNSNTIDRLALKKMYLGTWRYDLDTAIRARSAVKLVLDRNDDVWFELSKDEVDQLAPLVLNEDDLSDIGLGTSLLHAFHLISLKPAAPDGKKLEEVKRKYGQFQLSLLLGRYDALAIGEILETDTGPNPQARFQSVSRLKRLVPVEKPKPAGQEAPPSEMLAAVLISLKWDASRITFAIWLSSRLPGWAKRLTPNIYLSDGWDDAVVVIPIDNSRELNEQIVGLTRLIRFLNESPLVTGTETLLSHRVLEDETILRYRFVCGRGPDGLRPTRSSIETALVKMSGWRIENLSGVKDLQILLDIGADAFAIYRALHEAAADGHFRVETRVSWP